MDLSKKFAGSPFTILGISSDHSAGAWRRYVQDHDLSWPQYLDRDHRLSHLFHVHGIPTFFLIDQNGGGVYHQAGWGDIMEPMLESMIEDCLKRAGEQAKPQVYANEPVAQSHVARTAIDSSGSSSEPMPLLPGLSPGRKPSSGASSSEAAPASSATGGVTAPETVYQPKPPYTKAAREDGIEGTVTLQIVVNAQGKVTNVKEVGAHLGYGLDENAIATVRNWRFMPAMRGGAPVPVRVTVEVAFRLGEEP